MISDLHTGDIVAVEQYDFDARRYAFARIAAVSFVDAARRRARVGDHDYDLETGRCVLFGSSTQIRLPRYGEERGA